MRRDREEVVEHEGGRVLGCEGDGVGVVPDGGEEGPAGLDEGGGGEVENVHLGVAVGDQGEHKVLGKGLHGSVEALHEALGEGGRGLERGERDDGDVGLNGGV